MSNFYTLLTRVGAALHANAQVNQTTVPWTHLRLGDGNGAPVTPTENQTGLVRQVHTLQITDIAVHPDNPNWVIAEAVVPSDVGGWTVRETAIYGGADGNTCIAVGNYPETYKPVLAEGAGREMVMRMVVEISSVATVKLQIDPAVAIASRAWVESLVATPAKAGLVKLANLQEHIDGETSSKSATPSGVHAIVGIATEQVMGEVLLVKQSVAESGLVVFDVSGVYTWVVPDVLKSGKKKASVIVTGGGGAGGANPPTGGGGGCAGGTAIKKIDLTGVDVVEIVIGAGGVATSVASVPGGNGGTSSFGAFCSATGGDGGDPNTAFEGGDGIGGDINLTGGNGVPAGQGGQGGASYWGGGGRRAGTYDAALYADGKAPGSGGGGGGNDLSGKGADGIVTIGW